MALDRAGMLLVREQPPAAIEHRANTAPGGDADGSRSAAALMASELVETSCWTPSTRSGENHCVPEHGTSGPSGGPRWPLAVALLIIGAVATADVMSGDRAVLIGLMTSATLLCGLTASPALTRLVAILAVSVAALSFVWNDNLGTWTYWVPLTVVTLSGGFAWLMAVYRQRLAGADRELLAIFSTVDVAIMVRDAQGRLVHANQAAADLLRLPDVDAVMAATSQELMNRFEVYTEDGRAVSLGDLPGSRLLKGEANPAPVLVRNIVKATGEERWLLNSARAIGPEGGRPLLAVNLIEDLTETKRAELAQRLLAEAAQRGGEPGDEAAMLQAIAEAAVPGFADWAGVDLFEGGRAVRTVAIAHIDPEKVRLGWRLRTDWPVDLESSGGISEVIRTGRPQLVQEIPNGMLEQAAVDKEHLEVLHAIGLKSTMIVPLTAGTQVLGALSYVSSTARRFSRRDLELACDLGRQVGISLKNTQLNEERARIAQTLQASLLPESIPEIAGWRISSVYRAAGAQNIVGGDFYDFVAFDGGWAAIIGDVVGKGAPAAALTALVRHTAATMVESTGDPAAALQVVNRRLCERGREAPDLCTAAIVAIVSDEAVICSAGHPLPLLRRGDQVMQVGRTSPLLGIDEDAEFTTIRLPILPDDQLLLYTDGVTDAPGRSERFGEERLIEALGALDSEVTEIAGRVLEAVDRYLTTTQPDDIAVISMAREAPAVRPRKAAA
jgi:PAS domain-containing protein